MTKRKTLATWADGLSTMNVLLINMLRVFLAFVRGWSGLCYYRRCKGSRHTKALASWVASHGRVGVWRELRFERDVGREVDEVALEASAFVEALIPFFFGSPSPGDAASAAAIG